MSKPVIVDLKAEPRAIGASASQHLRSGNQVPAVMYGPKMEENIHFSIAELDLERILKVKNVQIIRIHLEGKTYDTVVKLTDFHPVTDRPIHVDFYNYADDVRFVIAVPIRLTGKAAGLAVGGKLSQSLQMLKIRTLASTLPAEVFADVTPLNIGDSMKVKDVQWGDFEVVTEKQRLLVTVSGARK